MRNFFLRPNASCRKLLLAYGGNMSHLPPQAIADFQALWQKCYGEPLKPEDAMQRAHQVFELINLLMNEPFSNATSDSTHIEAEPKNPTAEFNP